MDWAKAKTILITVFLIINLFLCYQVFSARIGNISYVDREKIGEVISYLQSKDVLVEGEIPYRKLDVPALTVQYKLFDQDELKQIFFPQGEAVASTYGASIVKLSGTSTDVSLRNGTELDFKNASIEPETGEIDEKKTQSLIDAWLRNLGIRPKDKFEKSKLKEAGFLVFKYEQLYKGLAIYNSHMLFNTNASGIREASVVWFDSVKPLKQKTRIVSPADALLRAQLFVEKSELGPIKITGIEQGYYFSTGENTQLDVSKVVKGTAFPVWKVTTDKGIIYINAMTLIIEGFKKAV